MHTNWAAGQFDAPFFVFESDHSNRSGSASPPTEHPVQPRNQSFDDLTIEQVTTSESPADLATLRLQLEGTPSLPSGRGSRFPSSALLVLKAWFAAHYEHPYPSSKDFEALQGQTGLSQSQLSTWFANARRRAKPKTNRTKRSDSPAPQLINHPYMLNQLQDAGAMSPLQRWRNSPPENEVADASDISRALRSIDYSPADSPYPDVLVESSRRASSTGSAGTNDSALSADSVHSGSSAFSASSTRSFRRRRRRAWRPSTQTSAKAVQARPAATSYTLMQFPDTFQCTFCTQTFKTKHNWQRHEKSLHLSLEAWECSPDGPLGSNDDQQGVICVYCGETSPTEAHLASHNYQSCCSKPARERTFFRKDHLIQHLRLTHRAPFVPETMLRWRHEHQDVKSRCGFCDHMNKSWTERTNHLAEHFKKGQTMAQWKGSWGFEPAVLNMVESSMPPYLIEFERKTPLPFKAGHPPPRGPSTAYELLHLELEYSLSAYVGHHNRLPTTAELQYEACQIIFAAEVLWNRDDKQAESWLYDLLTSSDEIAMQARNCSAKNVASLRPTELRILGKSNMFEGCRLEQSLIERVFSARDTGNTDTSDGWLQEQAREIVLDTNKLCQPTTGLFADFLVRLVDHSTEWLLPFRSRTPMLIEQRIYATGQENALRNTNLLILPVDAEPPFTLEKLENFPTFEASTNTETNGEPSPDSLEASYANEKGVGFLDHSNYYRELVHNLTRFIASSTSPRNPTRHIPSDEELQRQARWIEYDDDDPWNQTPADNPDWLRDFKHSVGLHVNDEDVQDEHLLS
ncbi:hypothetical protein CC79DRAFT_1397574 [Sarocladium strictum]